MFLHRKTEAGERLAMLSLQLKVDWFMIAETRSDVENSLGEGMI